MNGAVSMYPAMFCLVYNSLAICCRPMLVHIPSTKLMILTLMYRAQKIPAKFTVDMSVGLCTCAQAALVVHANSKLAL